MLLHANHKWPHAISAHLWPYACRMAALVHNIAPRDRDGETPVSLFTRQTRPPKVRYSHTFGCPTYVLHRDLQGGKKINKWIERARVGINLGPSPKHASSVSLVLNPATGLVSPQFHVKHDDFFETISDRSDRHHEDGYWKNLAQLKTSPTRRKIDKRINAQRLRQDIADTQEERSSAISHLRSKGSQITRENAAPRLRRSKRIQELNEIKRNTSNRTDNTDLSFAAQSDTDIRIHELFTEAASEQFDLQDQQLDPVAFATSADPDIMHLHQALGEPDRDKFIEAMDKEVQGHVKRGHWKIVHRNEVPQDQRILDAVWSMKRKRRITTREVYRWKARLTVHGGQQQHGINYWETYSPVVNWFSVRIFLTLAILHGWQTRQINFVLAFPQADVECNIFMKIPRGFDLGDDINSNDYCLQLIKNLYGQKQAGRVWNQHLHQGLINMGFQQSSIDPCVYYRRTTIFLCYVDDSIIISPNAEDIDATIKELQVNYDVTDEGEIDDYLGIKVQRQEDNMITLTQPHLIDSILKDVKLDSPNTITKPYPAATTVLLHKDPEGEDHDAPWNYRSIIGKLNFLEKSTRPDIAYAVHQCARFSSNPKKLHTKAVLHLCAYLAGTKDKGLQLKPNRKSIKCWVDSDFCGLWDKNWAEYDRMTARSRTGYVICYGGFPIIWNSKLQTEIALSSTEAEYIALSEALRQTIVIMNLLKECIERKLPIKHEETEIKCTAFEDNQGALELAKTPKLRPRTRHINIKYHHFRSKVEKGNIAIKKVSTQEQLADILTKPMEEGSYRKLRRELLGW